MADELSWVPPGVDTKRANVARVYDYWLGGSHNFLADQDVARAIMAVEPNARVGVRANRAFLGRAVRFLAANGIGQFLDIGSGIPTEGNVHEIAQDANPAARVVYADIDPVAVAHSRSILAGNENAAVIEADLREPRDILAERYGPPTDRLPASRPGCCSSWCCTSSATTRIRGGSWRRCATRSRPAATWCWVTARTRAGRVVAQAAEKVYNRSVATQVHMRSRADILRFFDGFDLVDPGLVYIPEWRPDSPERRARRPGQVLGPGRRRPQAMTTELEALRGQNGYD